MKKKKKIKLRCKTCGKKFQREKGKKNFCSSACRGYWIKEIRMCKKHNIKPKKHLYPMKFPHIIDIEENKQLIDIAVKHGEIARLNYELKHKKKGDKHS